MTLDVIVGLKEVTFANKFVYLAHDVNGVIVKVDNPNLYTCIDYCYMKVDNRYLEIWKLKEVSR